MSILNRLPPWEAPPRGGGGHLLAAGVRKASHIPVLFGGRGQSAALGHSPSGLAYLHTNTHTRTPHSAPGGKQPGARSAAHPARRGWEGGQTTTTNWTVFVSI